MHPQYSVVFHYLHCLQSYYLILVAAVQIRIRSRCPNDPFRQLCPYCKGAGYYERWIPLALVRYVVGQMSYIILDRRTNLAQLSSSPPRDSDDAEPESCPTTPCPPFQGVK